jgi:WD40 repeat protein
MNSIASVSFNIPQQHFRSIDHFPLDVLRLICSYLDSPKDTIHLGLASWSFTVLLSDTELWDTLLHKHFPSFYAKLQPKTESLSLYKRLTYIAHNIKTGKYHFQRLKGHQSEISCMTIWGDKLISASGDQTVKIWDLHTEQVKTLGGSHNWINCMTIWGDKLITGSPDYKLRIWDLNSGQKLQTLKGHTNWIRCVMIWGDKLISGASDWTIKVWDLNTGRELQTLLGHNNWVNCMTIWGDKLISGSDDKTFKIWDLNSGELLQTRYFSVIYCMTIWKDKLILSLDNYTITIWDLPTEQEDRPLKGLQEKVKCMTTWGDMLISGQTYGWITIWDLNTGQELQKLLCERRGEICCITILDDDKLISGSEYDKVIKVLDFSKRS